MRFADKPYTYLVQCTQQQIELTPIALQQDIPLLSRDDRYKLRRRSKCIFQNVTK